MDAASCRAAASSCSWSALSWSACAWACSACRMPPSIFSERSSSTAFMRGRTKRMKTSAKISRKTADQTISCGSGMSSLQPGTSASARIMGSTSDEDEAGDDRQQRQDLGERDTDQHRGLQLRAQLGLTGLRSEEHTSELQSRGHLVSRLLL